MARKIISISLPPEFYAFVEGRIRDLGHGSTSEYFRSLIREDYQRLNEGIRQQRRREEAEQFGSQAHFRRRH